MHEQGATTSHGDASIATTRPVLDSIAASNHIPFHRRINAFSVPSHTELHRRMMHLYEQHFDLVATLHHPRKQVFNFMAALLAPEDATFHIAALPSLARGNTI